MNAMLVCKKKQNIVLGISIILILVFDVLSKSWIMKHIPYHTSVPVTSFFNLVFTLNQGVSFSMFWAEKAQGVYLLIALTSLLSLFVFYCMYKGQQFLEKLSFSFILAGAIGNLLDRIRFGGVVDFLDVHIGGYHWPAFNVADSFICIGVGLLFLYYFVLQKNNRIFK